MLSVKDAELALKKLRAPFFRLTHPCEEAFDCPACGYAGPFQDKANRRHAKCPACGALERARLQFVVLKRLLADFSPERKRALHIAPEPAFRRYLRRRFLRYESRDLQRKDVDHRLDVQQLPFADGRFDLVFASHVLEYPADDLLAIREIRRVLRAGCVALLPVPLLRDRTVDRSVRDPVSKVMHEPGLDYFERMEAHLRRVDIVRSDHVSPRYQPFLRFAAGHKPAMPLVHRAGTFIDVVPVCDV